MVYYPRSVFRVIDVPESGKPEEHLGPELVAPPLGQGFRWIDLVESDAASLQLLGERFGFHPLEIEDCATFELHSKLEEYPDHLFIVLHAFTEDPGDELEIQVHEIHAFLHERYLVTVHDNPVPAADQVWRRAASDPRTLRSPAWALYSTADAMVDAIFPLLDKIAVELERIEEKVLDDPDEDELAKIFQLRGTLVSMRRVIRPLRDVIAMLTRRKKPPMTKRAALYFRDVHDHVLRCVETIEEAQGLVESAMDAYRSAVTNRTNDIMARLTLFSVIFLPLGFLTGFWGQNFSHLPVGNATFFWATLAITVLVPIGLLFWFRRKGWM
jgi:magnesium transporter